MKIRWFPALAVFLGSYLPLAIILAVQDLNFAVLRNGISLRLFAHGKNCEVPLHHPVLASVFVVVSGLCFALQVAALRLSRPSVVVNIKESKCIPAELMSYTLPYVVAFMTIGYDDMAKFSGFLLFLAWMFLITYRSGQILLNPVLAVLGWRLYEVKYAFPGDKVIHTGRGLYRSELEADSFYTQTTVQDILIIGNKTFAPER